MQPYRHSLRVSLIVLLLILPEFFIVISIECMEMIKAIFVVFENEKPEPNSQPILNDNSLSLAAQLSLYFHFYPKPH